MLGAGGLGYLDLHLAEFRTHRCLPRDGVDAEELGVAADAARLALARQRDRLPLERAVQHTAGHGARRRIAFSGILRMTPALLFKDHDFNARDFRRFPQLARIGDIVLVVDAVRGIARVPGLRKAFPPVVVEPPARMRRAMGRRVVEGGQPRRAGPELTHQRQRGLLAGRQAEFQRAGHVLAQIRERRHQIDARRAGPFRRRRRGDTLHGAPHHQNIHLVRRHGGIVRGAHTATRPARPHGSPHPNVAHITPLLHAEEGRAASPAIPAFQPLSPTAA